MHKNYPQYVEAGNERCVYVMRESEELAPINLDELRGLKIEKNTKIIIMIMNTDDMLIAYSDNARNLVDSFDKKFNLLRRHHVLRLNIIWVCTYFTISKRAFSL